MPDKIWKPSVKKGWNGETRRSRNHYSKDCRCQASQVTKDTISLKKPFSLLSSSRMSKFWENNHLAIPIRNLFSVLI